MPKDSSYIDLKVCPNCGVAAIPVESTDKPGDEVECNNCHHSFEKREVVKPHRRKS